MIGLRLLKTAEGHIVSIFYSYRIPDNRNPQHSSTGKQELHQTDNRLFNSQQQ